MYRKSVGLLTITAFIAWTAYRLRLSLITGDLRGEAITVAKWATVLVPMLLLWFAVVRLPVVSAWAAKGYRNTILIDLPAYLSLTLTEFFFYPHGHSFIGSCGEGVFLAICMTIFFGPTEPKDRPSSA